MRARAFLARRALEEQLIELPDLGHTPQLEDPDLFMNVASQCFDRVAATSGGRQGAYASLERAAND